MEVTLHNNEAKEVSGVLHGQFGEIRFESKVTVPAGAEFTVKLNPTTTPELHLKNPKLWWPAGYGEQNLYDVKLWFESGRGDVSDRKEFRAGVRQFTYTEENEALKIYINGRRFIARGETGAFRNRCCGTARASMTLP